MLLDRLKMEFVGCFFISYIFALTACNYESEICTVFAVTIGQFFVVMIFTWISKPISGAQFNPCITSSLAITGHLDFDECLYTLFLQLLGTIFGASLAEMSLPNEIIVKISEEDSALGMRFSVSIMKGLLLELIAAFFLVFVYYRGVLERNAMINTDGPIMGAVYFILTNYLFLKTGAAINPFRPIAFSLINTFLPQIWVYIVANIIGGVLGGLLANTLMSETAMEMKRRLEKLKIKKENEARMTRALEAGVD